MNKQEIQDLAKKHKSRAVIEAVDEIANEVLIGLYVGDEGTYYRLTHLLHIFSPVGVKYSFTYKGTIFNYHIDNIKSSIRNVFRKKKNTLLPMPDYVKEPSCSHVLQVRGKYFKNIFETFEDSIVAYVDKKCHKCGEEYCEKLFESCFPIVEGTENTGGYSGGRYRSSVVVEERLRVIEDLKEAGFLEYEYYKIKPYQED